MSFTHKRTFHASNDRRRYTIIELQSEIRTDSLSGSSSMPGLSMLRTIEGGAANRVKGSDTQLEIVDTGEIVTID